MDLTPTATHTEAYSSFLGVTTSLKVSFSLHINYASIPLHYE